MSVELDLAWLGGIVDGEGTISINLSNKRNGYHFCRIGIVNTDEGIIEKVKEILTSLNLFYTLHTKTRMENRKQCYIVEVNRQHEALELAKLLMPVLHSYKKGRCLEVIEYATKHTHDKIGRRLNLRRKKSI